MLKTAGDRPARAPFRAFIGAALAALATLTLAQTEASEPIFVLSPGGHFGNVQSLDWSGDGSVLLTGSWDRTARLWDVATGDQAQVFRGRIGAGFEGEVHAVAAHPKLPLYATTGVHTARVGDETMYTIRLFRRDGQIRQVLAGHPGFSVRSLAFNPSGQLLASGSAGDFRIRLWPIADSGETMVQRPLAILSVPSAEQRQNDGVSSLAFSADGSRLAAASADGFVRVFDVEARKLLWEKQVGVPAGLYPMVAYSPNGFVAATGADNKVSVFAEATGEEVSSQTASATLTAVSFNRTGTQLAVALQASGDQAARLTLFQVDGGRLSGARTSGPVMSIGGVNILRASPSRDLYALGGLGGEVVLVDPTALDQPPVRLGGRGSPIYRVAWDRSGRYVGISTRAVNVPIALSTPRAEFAYDVQAARLLSPSERDPQANILGADNQPINWLAPRESPAGVTVEAPLFSRSITVRGDRVGRRTLNLAEGDYVTSGSPVWVEGGFFVGTRFGIREYRFGDQTWRRTFVGHAAEVLGLAVSPDGRWLASASVDWTVRIWPLRGQDDAAVIRKPAMTIFASAPDNWVAWVQEGFFTASPVGERLVGLHRNRGNNEAADFSNSLFSHRDRFYSPDVMASVLPAEGDVRRAVRLSRERLAEQRKRADEERERRIAENRRREDEERERQRKAAADAAQAAREEAERQKALERQRQLEEEQKKAEERRQEEDRKRREQEETRRRQEQEAIKTSEEVKPIVEVEREEPPPTVRILTVRGATQDPSGRWDLTSDSPTVQIEVEIGGPKPAETVVSIQAQALPRGKDLGFQRRDTSRNNRRLLSIDLSPGESEIRLQPAYLGAKGTEVFGQSVELLIQRKAAAPAPTARKRSLYVLAVGISQYASEDVRDLRFADGDARAFGQFFGTLKRVDAAQTPENRIFETVDVTILENAQATTEGVRSALNALATKIKADAASGAEAPTVIFFFSGHGEPVQLLDRSSRFALVTSDYSRNAAEQGAPGILWWDGVAKSLAEIGPGLKFVFLDCCYAESALSGVNEMMRGAGNSLLLGLASSGSGEKSFESEKLERGFFTHTILKMLSDQADVELKAVGAGRTETNLMNRLRQESTDRVTLNEVGRLTRVVVPLRIAEEFGLDSEPPGPEWLFPRDGSKSNDQWLELLKQIRVSYRNFVDIAGRVAPPSPSN